MRAAAVLALLAAACGSAQGGATAPTRTVTVFAAASLSQAFPALEHGFQGSNPGYRVTFNFAGTPTLVTQLEQGARADVLASADTTNMGKAQAAGLVAGRPEVFARNMLEIAVPPGNPRHIQGLQDLASPTLTLVLAAPNVPAGRYAAQALRAAGVTAHPKSLEVDVESVLAKVELGEADAGIVYATDVRAATGRVEGVTIPAAENVVATYPVAALASAGTASGARAFIRYLLSAAGQAVLRRYGFESP